MLDVSNIILYLEGRKNTSEQNVFVSAETYISIFCLSYCKSFDFHLCLVDSNCPLDFIVPLHTFEKFKVSWKRQHELPETYCKVPVVFSEVSNLFVSGLCSVLRWLMKTLADDDDQNPAKYLLGFRGGCLSACSESSVWTKFCEVDLPNATKEIIRMNSKISAIHSCLVKLESHLGQPVKTHNISKRKHDILKKNKTVSNSLAINTSGTDGVLQTKTDLDVLTNNVNELFIKEGGDELDHCFLEGIDLTLADIIALPCIHFILEVSYISSMHLIPNIVKWYQNMMSLPNIKECTDMFSWTDISSVLNAEFLCPENHVNHIIEDPKPGSNLHCRVLPEARMKCKNFDPTDIINLLKENHITPHVEEYSFSGFDWNQLPRTLHPSKGDLPKSRIERKSQQLESIVGVVLAVAQPKQIIVDFCSGGGHVGLLLAHLLPSCQVFLVENKEESMMRARNRSEVLGLKNIKFFQCNMDYFKASFHVGVSLHACGVATDLVINKCLEQQASFVCCPCCYGGIKETDDLKYPLSHKFQSLGISAPSFSLLARCADRTELNTVKEQQGIYCMGLIDTDRKYYAEEHDYNVVLTTLQPPTCSTKHNLLVGQKNV